MKPSREVFAARMRAIRESKGMSQADLAEKAGMEQGQVSKLERGLSKAGPLLDTVDAIAKGLGVAPSALLDGRARP